MGACFITETIDETTESKVKQKFREIQEECEYEYGHDSYNGTFSTMSGISCRLDEVFPTYASAEEYISDNTSKWGNAMAVTVQEKDKKPYTLIGGWAAE